MVQEYGGESLLEYVRKNINKYIIGKRKRWRKHVQKLFKQLVLHVNFLHNNNVCHLDISLENCVINKKHNVGLIDFGLAQMFNDSNKFMSNKYGAGKVMYQCNEIYYQNSSTHKQFDASKADSWCLGVCLWIMLTGKMLYYKPTYNDFNFRCIINGNIQYIIKRDKLSKYVDNIATDLLNKIFTIESKRISIQEILQHKYLSKN